MARFQLRCNSIEWSAAAISVLFVALGCFGQTSLADDAVQWGDASQGLRVGIAVDSLGRAQNSPHEFHPGEMAALSIYYKADDALLIPKYGSCDLLDIHVMTPRGTEFILAGYQQKPPATLTAGDWQSWKGWDPPYRKLRLSVEPQGWTDASGKPAAMSLRDPGSYRVWVEANFPSQGSLPAHAWFGHARSGEATWKTSDLPADQRRRELTPQQRSTLGAWLSGKDEVDDPAGTPIWTEDWLTTQMELTENEALAHRLLEVVQGRGKYADGAMNMLSARAGETWEMGIDGPYLKDLTMWEMDELQPSAVKNGQGDIGAVGSVPGDIWVYLAFHPEDQSTPGQLIALAKASAPADKRWSFLSSTKPTGPRPPLGRWDAWDVLLRLNVLTAGMKVDQAKLLLGAPDEQSATSLQWDSGPYPNQGTDLIAALHDGKVSEWRREEYPTFPEAD